MQRHILTAVEIQLTHVNEIWPLLQNALNTNNNEEQLEQARDFASGVQCLADLAETIKDTLGRMTIQES